MAFLRPGAVPDRPEGAVVSGSRDTTVIVWDTAAAAPALTLEGHKYQVRSVQNAAQRRGRPFAGVEGPSAPARAVAKPGQKARCLSVRWPALQPAI